MIIRKIKKKLAKIFKSRRNLDYQKVSYSQSGEDLIVRFIFDSLHIYTPSYIDIGAHHPYFISNTALFYKNGSRGINIEPDPNLFVEFGKHRVQDINLNIGISDSNDELDFYTVSPPTLNTFSKDEATKYLAEGNYKITNIEKVEVRTLKNVLDEYANGIFPQYLTLDAEGIDEIIIKEIDFENNYPIVICIETISFSGSGSGVKNKQIIEFIENKGYLLYADTNINTIFVREKFWRKDVK